MRILPKTPAQRIERLSVLLPSWERDPEAVGLTEKTVSEMRALLDEAKAAHSAALAARQAAVDATLAFEEATERLTRSASPAVATIKAFAACSTDPAQVLAQASLPSYLPRVAPRLPSSSSPHAPAPPASATFSPSLNTRRRHTNIPPPQPTGATVTVDQRGQAIITWKTGAGGAKGARLGRQSRGRTSITYTVERTDRRTGATILLDCTTRPRTIDPAPLPGPSTYTIRALPTSGRARNHSGNISPPLTTLSAHPPHPRTGPDPANAHFPCTTALLELPES